MRFFIFFLIGLFLLIPITPSLAQTGSGGSGIDNPLGKTTTIPSLVGNIISAVLGIVGSLALIMFIYGGFTWMMAAGNNEAVQKGKNILTWAAIGLVVIFASYSLVRFVLMGLGVGAGTE